VSADATEHHILIDPEEIANIIRDWDDAGLLTWGQADVLGERIAASVQAAYEAQEATR
jgi:hypothetical protein